MRDEGVFCDHDPIHVDCLRLCFMPLIQQELHTVAKQWNLHNIRPSHNAESPSGRPVKAIPARVKSSFWWPSGMQQLDANHIDRLNR